MTSIDASDLTVELCELFLSIQRALLPTVSIEVGAWQAEFSHEIKSQMPDIDAWAFEANEHNYKANVGNAYKAGIHYTHVAVTDHCGTTRFMMQEKTLDGKVYGKEIGNNSVLIRNEGNIVYHAPKVICTTLDSFFVDQERITATDRICLWIDVEGASKEVLTTSNAVLKQTQSVFIEVEHYPFWKDQWLSDQVDAFMRANDFISVANDNQQKYQNNHIYLKASLINHTEINDILATWHERT